jgi:hypothetical protein
VAYIPVAPVYNWGGIYYGINGGYGFGKSEWTNPLNPAASSTGNFNISGYRWRDGWRQLPGGRPGPGLRGRYRL